MAESGSTAPGRAGNNTCTGPASNDTFTAGGGNDTVYAGGGDDRVAGDGPLTGQWTYAVYSRDFTDASNQTSLIATGTLRGTGYVDDVNVLAFRYTLAGAAQGTNRDDFGVICKSTLNITATGTYTFGTTSDDGSRIIIRDAAGNIVFDLDNDRHQVATTVTGSVTLQAGQTYSIELYYWENLGESVFSARIAGPGCNPVDLATAPQVGTSPLAAGNVDGNDLLYGQAGNDTLSGGGGDDTLHGGTKADSLPGETGNELLFGDAGDDVIDDVEGARLSGRNLVRGGDGRDRIYTGFDNDTIDGEEGDDLVVGGAGADQLFGGDGRDAFVMRDGDFAQGDYVDGGGDDDTLDLSGYGWSRVRVTYTSADRESGHVTFYEANGAVLGTMTFTEIAHIIPCFTAGTLIDTPTGPRPVEDLRPGDMVLTLDDGPQTVRCVGLRALSLADLLADPSLQPVEIAAGALGDSVPEQAIRVSQQHRILCAGAACELFFGTDEVLIPAIQMLGHRGIRKCLAPVTYVHVIFDRHQIVRTLGMWSESLQPCKRVPGGMPDPQRDELLRLFPELDVPGSYPAARMTLKGYETRVLLAR